MAMNLHKCNLLTFLAVSICLILQAVPGNFYGIVSYFEEIEVDLFDIDSDLTPFENCGGSEATLKSVELTPCNLGNHGHCELKRGTNVTFKLSFLSNVDSKSLEAKIYGIIEFVPVPFPSPQPDACMDSGVTCPILKGHLYNYSISAPIKEKYPKASLWIKGELRDDNNRNLVCVEVPVTIV